MHGRRREKLPPDQLEKLKAHEAQKVKEYKSLNSHVMELKAKDDFSGESLVQTTKLLRMNPELHSIWNYRRLIIISILSNMPEEASKQEYLDQELQFLEQIIRKNIKSYWMWNHRRWVLEAMPNPSWDRELALVSKMLEIDARNFHGWNYRRNVVEYLRQLSRDPSKIDQKEFDYTTEKIVQDCANHAAWHNRSKLLPSILEKQSSLEERENILLKEKEMIKTAIYTDPEDQNAWLYHEWLVSIQPSLEKKNTMVQELVETIKELLELEPDCKWPYSVYINCQMWLEQNIGQLTGDTKRECLSFLEQLMDMDKYHIGRYKDMHRNLCKKWEIQQ
ncbi:Rab geranylgeranyltransferase [Mycoemilia scoparia]|uniref:Geranylgeranyl transferase type-2 subunit alpha n=1 Tax=Mycoemilia scoparia TaxID=417184 RepID=A0A9W7ZYN9_9FUNG|nr:Rab geranylgeranyltransferase [Mycoemilia scoparia]